MQYLRDSSSVETLIFTTMGLGGLTPVEYGMDLGKIYPVGKKGVNNGILILLSKKDRQFQILTGSGLEWNLTEHAKHRLLKKDALRNLD